MNLSVSQLAFKKENENIIFRHLKEYGFSAIEVVPGMITEDPYNNQQIAKDYSKILKQNGFCISSMQSIWYGRKERLFSSNKEREFLLEYTKKAIDFASIIDCHNIVFGCPKNRIMLENYSERSAMTFFKELGDYADYKKISLNIEANPVIYNTDYINYTSEALDLIKKVDSKGFGLNLDVGTMIYNKESLKVLNGNEQYIKHVHISEPYLRPIEKQSLHIELKDYLKSFGYNGYVSIEMNDTGDINDTLKSIEYIGGIFK